MASITMSARSSDEDVVGPGAGGEVGSALAVPIANAESPITAPATADNSHRMATPFAFHCCSLIHAKLALDRIRRTLNTTNVKPVRQHRIAGGI
jgi:hypothetical protein